MGVYAGKRDFASLFFAFFPLRRLCQFFGKTAASFSAKTDIFAKSLSVLLSFFPAPVSRAGIPRRCRPSPFLRHPSPSVVILRSDATKDLKPASQLRTGKILRCAQDDAGKGERRRKSAAARKRRLFFRKTDKFAKSLSVLLSFFPAPVSPAAVALPLFSVIDPPPLSS